MKKIIILLVLFALLLILAIFLVVNETQKRTNAAALLNSGSTEKEGKINTEFFEGKRPSATLIPTNAAAQTLFLTLSSPTTNQTVSGASILVKGMTVPLTPVMINEFELTADSQGNFSKSLSLDEGENYISVIAYNSEGQVVEKELVITREVQE
ncbi:hypothetical protein HZC27_03755 [Candidatus Roizmanbacteria bacterium]|nr:hypothetical protein [Candidatus Roizmanbacteria bacterium]